LLSFEKKNWKNQNVFFPGWIKRPPAEGSCGQPLVLLDPLEDGV
jgi:hypothetical protein